MNGTPTNTPPAHAPDAVATNLGWMDPRTGELLVSARNLENPIDLRSVPRREYVFAINQELRRRQEAIEAQAPEKPEKVEPEQTEKQETVETPAVEVKEPKVKKAPTKKTSKKSSTKKTVQGA